MGGLGQGWWAMLLVVLRSSAAAAQGADRTIPSLPGHSHIGSLIAVQPVLLSLPSSPSSLICPPSFPPTPPGSLDSMFELYKELLPEMGGYLTHAGELHRGRLQLFMARLAAAEADVLHARAEVGGWGGGWLGW